LVSAGVDNQALVVATLQPVAGQTVIQSAASIGNESAFKLITTGPKWLVMNDSTPKNPFGHDIEIILFDAVTGEVSTRENMVGPIAINGVHRWFGLSDLMLVTPNESGDDVTVFQSPEIVQYPEFTAPLTQEIPQVDENMLSDIAGVRVRRNGEKLMVGDREVELFGFVVSGTAEPWFVESAFQMLRFFRNNKVPDANIMGAVPSSAPIANISMNVLNPAPNNFVEQIQKR